MWRRSEATRISKLLNKKKMTKTDKDESKSSKSFKSSSKRAKSSLMRSLTTNLSAWSFIWALPMQVTTSLMSTLIARITQAMTNNSGCRLTSRPGLNSMTRSCPPLTFLKCSLKRLAKMNQTKQLWSITLTLGLRFSRVTMHICSFMRRQRRNHSSWYVLMRI